MKRRVFKNKKGFTLVELIVTIAIMAILAAAVTPAVYVTTKRRQKSAAETDTQTMYRNAIAAVTYLSGQYIYPNKIDPRKEDVDNGTNGWYVEYSKKVCERIYKTVIGLDIPVKYYNPVASGTEKVLVPDGCNAVERSSFVNADNKNPYIVIQVVGVTAAESAEIVYYLIVSYHNDKNKFAAWDGGATVQTATLEYVTKDPTTNPQLNRAYQTNKGTPIRYTFKIRTK
ncbi:MAG: prepilin-type N-terminal cleavage/methylation domain-containing protein [Clostridiales bacterium]|nr:prepilin-type N-terminal cleavage/methylation domain-containing protein [Clostridiales bacterium]MDD7054814.1 prepilin-type N-terminal cleavage/methylation domain-containing protein [Clostridiales bacterium]MDY5190163.1 prepilin-type N-terminal cleavage/methylation domain-containing protein [Eubacteriales bacterium]